MLSIEMRSCCYVDFVVWWDLLKILPYFRFVLVFVCV